MSIQFDGFSPPWHSARWVRNKSLEYRDVLFFYKARLKKNGTKRQRNHFAPSLLNRHIFNICVLQWLLFWSWVVCAELFSGAVELRQMVPDEVSHVVVTNRPNPTPTLSLSLYSCTAPSAVPTVLLMRATAGTMSLSWLPPEQPNGVILDYEIKYHEKVRIISHHEQCVCVWGGGGLG